MKCAVYIRVSTDREEQKSSLVNQQRYFYNIIADKGWILHQFYIDVESGTKDKKRKNLKQMIEDAKAGLFDVIISKELSRLARNGKLSYEIKDVAENNGVHIVTYDNAINSIEGNIHMFGLYAWVYEQESQRTSERIKAALISGARKGEFMGANPPYGYQVVSKTLVPANDHKSEVVRRIFRMYLSGMGFDSIARTLSNEGLPTPAKEAGKRNAGRFWQGSTIRKILTNPHYTGDLVQHRETTRSVTSDARESVPEEKHLIKKDAHPPLVSRSDFQAVQELMKTRKRNRTKVQLHLFTNLLYCADCGSGMWYRQNRAGYICGSYGRHGKVACTSHAVKEDVLIKKVLLDIKKAHEFVLDQEYLNKIRQGEEERREANKSAMTGVLEELETLKNKRKKYIEMLADDIISHSEYREVSDEAEFRVKELKRKQLELQEALKEDPLNNELDRLKDLFARFEPFEEVTSPMLQYFVERIEVSKKGEPTVIYRFSLFDKLV
ncbi:recombinase family protein [Alteribacter natronophilus]|uniref:recombinase family protein n=1 Tax=Alteribacter natronophilus TaxID=2583810 RepID=UPI00110D44E9|nr:recombinase family protein [Alteribacter natronophilus]TMW71158.1 recombinase family protein [Alteribacter natronophilus]